MSGKKQWIKVKEWITGLKTKEIKKEQFFIILLFGVLLFIIALPVKNDSGETKEPFYGSENEETEADEEADETRKSDVDQYCRELEERLRQVLTQVSGAGEVEVMITLKYTQGMVVEKDLEHTSSETEESDSTGGERNSMETYRSESTVYTNGNEEPFVVKQSLPEIEGVVIVCNGGDNAVVKTEITEAVHALFAIDAHKIRIMKMK